MTTRRRKKHRPEGIVAKLRDAEAMLNAGKDLAAVLQALEVSESTLDRDGRLAAGSPHEIRAEQADAPSGLGELPPNAQAALRGTRESLVSRETVAEVPLAGLFY
jgi:hypothetical protein